MTPEKTGSRRNKTNLAHRGVKSTVANEQSIYDPNAAYEKTRCGNKQENEEIC